MGPYILRRLALIIPTLIGIMVINFALVQFVPGGPIEQILAQNGADQPQMYNLNIPTAATADGTEPEVRIVPMGLGRYGQDYIKRTDPKNRTYYWTSSDPPPRDTEHATDLNMLLSGYVTLTPLHFNMTHHERMEEMQNWEFKTRSIK